MSTTTQTTPRGPAVESPLEVTDRAAEQIRTIRDREDLSGHVLRISVVGGGCSGMSYRMGFVESKNEHDQVFEKNGVEVVVDPKSLLYLTGTVVDFHDGLEQSGFTFKNPNAQRTCGCGSSFSA